MWLYFKSSPDRPKFKLLDLRLKSVLNCHAVPMVRDDPVSVLVATEWSFLGLHLKDRIRQFTLDFI